MKKLLVVVDMQNDFIDGVLGTKEAQAIVPNVVKKIKEWDGDITYTLDTHTKDYLNTNEGKYLPVEHCIEHTPGWCLNDEVAKALAPKTNVECFDKPTFGSVSLMYNIFDNKYDYVEFIGLCTDICVVTNAILAKTYVPEAQIVVDASCCAGVTSESHTAALMTMKMCHIEVVNE